MAKTIIVHGNLGEWQSAYSRYLLAKSNLKAIKEGLELYQEKIEADTTGSDGDCK